MSPSGQWASLLTFCFPRVSGDEPVADFNRQIKSAFSPRERG